MGKREKRLTGNNRRKKPAGIFRSSVWLDGLVGHEGRLKLRCGLDGAGLGFDVVQIGPKKWRRTIKINMRGLNRETRNKAFGKTWNFYALWVAADDSGKCAEHIREGTISGGLGARAAFHDGIVRGWNEKKTHANENQKRPINQSIKE